MDTHACEDVWVRITDSPVTTRTFEDRTTGGLNGCFAYAVRPVGPNGEEGRLQIALRVYAGTYGEPMWCFGMSDMEAGWPRGPVPIQNEFDRVNSIQRGMRSAEDPPSSLPIVVGVTIETKNSYNSPYGTKVAHVVWGWVDSDPPSDLAGYHVEMAGSFDGPWQRLTKHPVAWWESEYVAKGIGVKKADGSFSGNVDCTHFRVIAVDEDGNESEPAHPYGYPRPECPLGATPAAPTGVQASTNTDLFGINCVTELRWDEVDYGGQDPALFEYHVRRLTFAEYRTFFYLADSVSADDQDCSDYDCCVDGVCRYMEVGYNPNQDPEKYCPWSSSPLCSTGMLEAYYVTVKGPAGGESPRSEIVFWDCNANPGYARLETCPVDEEITLLADSAVGAEVCESDPPGGDTGMKVARAGTNAPAASPAPSARPALSPAVPAIAGLLKLGQTPSGPPFKLIDLHVDHLGSTRVTTDEQGGVVTLHDYFPFGEEIVPMPDDSTKLFTGHERDDETGLDYMFARYYGAHLARFVSVDPVMSSVKPLAPQTWNRYSYANNNPILYVDPTGLLTYTATLLGRGIEVHIDDNLSEEEQEELKGKVDAAIDKINEAEDELTDEEKETVGSVSSITVEGDKSGIDTETGAFTVAVDFVTDSSPSYLASAIGHDGFHTGQQVLPGDDRANQKVTENRIMNELQAIDFQIVFGQKVGLSSSEVDYLRSVQDDLRAGRNTDWVFQNFPNGGK